MSEGKAKGFREDEHETLWFEDRIYVPNNAEIRKLILQEAHDSPYSIYLRNTKMYLDLKEHFWWTGMKKDIAEYVAVCDVCQRVKVEHQKPAGLLQPMPIPQMEVGQAWHGFHHRIAQDPIEIRFNLGSS